MYHGICLAPPISIDVGKVGSGCHMGCFGIGARRGAAQLHRQGGGGLGSRRNKRLCSVDIRCNFQRSLGRMRV